MDNKKIIIGILSIFNIIFLSVYIMICLTNLGYIQVNDKQQEIINIYNNKFNKSYNNYEDVLTDIIYTNYNITTKGVNNYILEPYVSLDNEDLKKITGIREHNFNNKTLWIDVNYYADDNEIYIILKYNSKEVGPWRKEIIMS